ncbi:hypothetical protein WSM22_18320 [Cytophagales bacterium WSM2-2]|nr:hypothetical protein WSM22_18320 [Cytophagales bacterium WSM2-2]
MKYMKKILMVVGGAALAMGCQDPEYPAPVTSSTVRSAKVAFINAAPDLASPGSFLVNNAEAASIALGANSIVTINPQSEQFRIKGGVFGVVTPGTVYSSDTVAQKDDLVLQSTLVGNGTYTIILTDTVKRPFTKGTGFATAKGGLTFTSLTDVLTAPAAGSTGIRFFNLAPGAPAVFLTSSTTTPSAGLAMPAAVSASKAYKATTATFTTITAGNYNLEVRTGSATGTIVATLPSTALADGKLYTIYVTGKFVKIGANTVKKVDYKLNTLLQN